MKYDNEGYLTFDIGETFFVSMLDEHCLCDKNTDIYMPWDGVFEPVMGLDGVEVGKNVTVYRICDTGERLATVTAKNCGKYGMQLR